MKGKLLTIAFTGATLLAGAVSAQAACVIPAGFPPNDVALEFPLASAASAPTAFEVDMNGVQRGLDDQLLWATHGTLVVIPGPAGAEQEWIASWTKNTYRVTAEWVCRMKRGPGAPIVGDGAVHTVDHITPTFVTPIDFCELTLADC